jgi:serine/threonine-protein kinase
MITDEGPAAPARGAQTLEKAATEVLDRAQTPRPDTAPLGFGRTLGKCLLIEELGRGGWCTVFRALHQSLQLSVAVKVLHVPADDPWLASARAQLRSEARLLARLCHPHIVRLFDFADDPALPYLVLECVDGPSLRELIRQSGRLQPQRARAVMRQVARGLLALRSIGAVHRDIKPGNLLMARDGNVKIADFGQAILPAEVDESATDSEPREVAGTVAYVAPEQFLAPALVDHRSDLYSLGVTFYEAVTGQLPFQGRSRMEVLMQHAHARPASPQSLVPELDPAMAELILRLLAKDPDDRPRDAAEVLRALDDALRPAPAVPPPAQAVPAAPPPGWWSLLVDCFRPRPRPDTDWTTAMRRTLFASHGNSGGKSVRV